MPKVNSRRRTHEQRVAARSAAFRNRCKPPPSRTHRPSTLGSTEAGLTASPMATLPSEGGSYQSAEMQGATASTQPDYLEPVLSARGLSRPAEENDWSTNRPPSPKSTVTLPIAKPTSLGRLRRALAFDDASTHLEDTTSRKRIDAAERSPETSKLIHDDAHRAPTGASSSSWQSSIESPLISRNAVEEVLYQRLTALNLARATPARTKPQPTNAFFPRVVEAELMAQLDDKARSAGPLTQPTTLSKTGRRPKVKARLVSNDSPKREMMLLRY